MSQVYDYSFLLLFGAPRVCLWIEIRRYKNTIRIRTILFFTFTAALGFPQTSVVFFDSPFEIGVKSQIPNYYPMAHKLVARLLQAS